MAEVVLNPRARQDLLGAFANVRAERDLYEALLEEWLTADGHVPDDYRARVAEAVGLEEEA